MQKLLTLAALCCFALLMANAPDTFTTDSPSATPEFWDHIVPAEVVNRTLPPQEEDGTFVEPVGECKNGTCECEKCTDHYCAEEDENGACKKWEQHCSTVTKCCPC